MAQNDDKAELILELAKARSAIGGNVVHLRRDLDFPTRARRAFKKSPIPWLVAAGLVGLVVARIPGRTKKVVKVVPKRSRDDDSPVEKAGKAGLVLGALKIAFDLARPALLKWATQRFSDYVAASHQPPPPRR